MRAGGVDVVPRDLFQALFEPMVTFPGDEETGFTAMKRTTGWSAGIVAGMLARGEIAPGAGGVERQVPAARFVEECRRRGFGIEL